MVVAAAAAAAAAVVVVVVVVVVVAAASAASAAEYTGLAVPTALDLASYHQSVAESAEAPAVAAACEMPGPALEVIAGCMAQTVAAA